MRPSGVDCGVWGCRPWSECSGKTDAKSSKKDAAMYAPELNLTPDSFSIHTPTVQATEEELDAATEGNDCVASWKYVDESGTEEEEVGGPEIKRDGREVFFTLLGLALFKSPCSFSLSASNSFRPPPPPQQPRRPISSRRAAMGPTSARMLPSQKLRRPSTQASDSDDPKDDMSLAERYKVYYGKSDRS